MLAEYLAATDVVFVNYPRSSLYPSKSFIYTCNVVSNDLIARSIMVNWQFFLLLYTSLSRKEEQNKLLIYDFFPVLFSNRDLKSDKKDWSFFGHSFI